MPTPDQIIDGYLKTEIEYVNTIKYVFANVYTPLHTALGTRSELVPAADLDSIFAQLSSIMEIASDFLATLRREGDGRAETFCDFFCRGIPDMFFKIHRGYMCNYPHAVRRLRSVCERSSKFADFIKTKLQPYGMSIEKCLKLPSTRLETYVRTLEATLTATPPSHPSYSKWQHGLLNIMSLFSRVTNDVALERDMCLMALLQKRFDGAVEIKETARISRRLVHSGSLRKVCRKIHKKFAFFLFSDLLVYGRGDPTLVADSRIRLHRAFPLDSIISFDAVPDTSVYRFQILVETTTDSFIVFAMSAEEQQQWVCAFKDNYAKSGLLPPLLDVIPPIWIPDTLCPSCSCCHRKFTLFNRRHHCRVCGVCVCSACCQNRVDLTYEKIARVCDSCMETDMTTRDNRSSVNFIGKDAEVAGEALNAVRARIDAHDRGGGSSGGSVAISVMGARSVGGPPSAASVRLAGSSHHPAASGSDVARSFSREKSTPPHVEPRDASAARSSAPSRPAKNSQTAASADPSTQSPATASHQRSKSRQAFQGEVIHEEEWTEYVDEASGKPYYHNAASNVTIWDKPPVVSAHAVKH